MSHWEGIDTVLLDAGGVLLVPDPDALRRIVEPFGIQLSDEDARAAHYECMAELDRIGVLDWPRVDSHLARTIGVPDDRVSEVVDLIETMYLREPWVPVAGAAEALVLLQEAGYRLAVVSNATGTIEQQLLDGRICSVTGGPMAQVEVVIDSHVVGVEKPDPGIFEIALDAIGGTRETCIYIGDTVFFDVNGARAAGIRPVHADPYHLCPGRSTGDHAHAASVAEVAGLMTSGAAG